MKKNRNTKIIYGSVLLIGVFCVFFNSTAQEIKIITLQQCFEYAEKNHAQQKEKDLLVKVLELRLQNLQSSLMPKAEAFAQATYQSDVISIDPGVSIPGLSFPSQKKDQYKFALELQQSLYDGGLVKAKKEVETANFNAQLSTLDVSIYKLRDIVSHLYFNILINKENLQILEIFNEELIQRITVVKSGIKNGVLPESNLWQLEIEQMKLKQKISELNHLNHSLLENLSVLTAMKLTPVADFILPSLRLPADSSVERKEYEWFNLTKLSLKESEKLFSAARRPRMTAFAQTGYGRPGLNMLSEDFDAYYLVGIRLGWTITDWKQSNREKQILGIQQQIIDSRRELFDQSLKISTNSELSAIARLRETIKEDRKIIDLHEKLLQVFSSKLDQGVIQPTEYLMEFNKLMESKIKLGIHEKQLVQSLVNYYYQMGVPINN